MKRIFYLAMIGMALLFTACGSKDGQEAGKKEESLSSRLKEYPHYSMQEDFSHDEEHQAILDAGFGGLYVYVPEEQYLSKETEWYTVFKIDDIVYSYDIRLNNDSDYGFESSEELTGKYSLSMEEYDNNASNIFYFIIDNLGNDKYLWISFNIGDAKNKVTTPEERKAFADQIYKSLELSVQEMEKTNANE